VFAFNAVDESEGSNKVIRVNLIIIV
jgi:hypothetical protein